MKKNSNILLMFIFLMNVEMLSQTATEGLVIKTSGYIDSYYATDNDQSVSLGNDNRKRLTALNVKKDQFDINMAQMTFDGVYNDFKFKTTLNFGSLSRFAFPSGQLNNIQEANVGVKLTNDVWLEGGLFLTHIGSEQVTPKDNWLSSHSLLTNFQPFYQQGVKFSYQVDSNLSTQVMLLNGYNTFEDNNQNKTLGYFVNYNLDSDYNISLAGVIGNEQPNTQTSVTRVYNNFVIGMNIDEDIKTKLTFDICNEGTKTMLGAFYSMRYTISEKFSTSMRLEYFDDRDGIFTNFINPSNQIDTKSYCLQNAYGATLGMEYRPNKNSFIRIEGRYLQSNNGCSQIFLNSNKDVTNNRLETIFNFGIYF